MSSMELSLNEHCTTKVTVSPPCRYTGLQQLTIFRTTDPATVDTTFKMMLSQDQLLNLSHFFASQAK